MTATRCSAVSCVLARDRRPARTSVKRPAASSPGESASRWFEPVPRPRTTSPSRLSIPSKQRLRGRAAPTRATPAARRSRPRGAARPAARSRRGSAARTRRPAAATGATFAQPTAGSTQWNAVAENARLRTRRQADPTSSKRPIRKFTSRAAADPPACDARSSGAPGSTASHVAARAPPAPPSACPCHSRSRRTGDPGLQACERAGRRRRALPG